MKNTFEFSRLDAVEGLEAEYPSYVKMAIQLIAHQASEPEDIVTEASVTIFAALRSVKALREHVDRLEESFLNQLREELAYHEREVEELRKWPDVKEKEIDVAND